ncbi:nitrilase-like protein 2 [Iris pallida]|uniref:Nitrilase-like protein 2 n=1 Tax=Iris pallida TaxID=29817 RepID=A0AAX6EFW3_IRIPA|nr:nitrilase-like protein 2 [Iris pallida]
MRKNQISPQNRHHTPFCWTRMALGLRSVSPISRLLATTRAPPASSSRSPCRVLKCSMSTSSSLRVGAAQMTSTNDLDANFQTCSRLVKEAVAGGVKLLCFPESFSFVSNKDGESLKIAETLDGPIMQRYCSLARESNIWLSLGGFQEKGSDEAHLYNTHVLVDDSGNIRNVYRKIFLFDVDVPGNMIYKESSFTTAGTDIVAADSPAGCLGLTVCYDLRFPELYQQLRFQHHAQVLLVPAAFTKVTGEAHWEILLRARAIETQCYVVAAAQTGRHNDKRESYGDSLIIDPWGTIVARLPDRLATGVAMLTLTSQKLNLCELGCQFPT